MVRRTGIILTNNNDITIDTSDYNSAILCISVCLSVSLSISFSISKKTLRTVNFKLDQCVALNLTMCLLYLIVYGCCQLTDLNDFLVVFSTLCYYRPSASAIGNSADGGAPCCLIGGRHRAVVTEGRNVNNRRKIGRTILTLPSVIIVSAVCIAQT